MRRGLWFPPTISGSRADVASAIIDALDELHLSFPEVDKSKKKELAAVRDSLLAQKD